MSNSLNWSCIYSKRKHTLIFAWLNRNHTFVEWAWIRALCPLYKYFYRKLPVRTRQPCRHEIEVYLNDVMRTTPRTTAILITAGAIALLTALFLFQQRTRTVKGTWIDLFEGSRFFEGQDISSACNPKFRDAPWFAYYPDEDSDDYKLIKANSNSGKFVSKHGKWPVAAYTVKFEGHHQLWGFGFGHMGSFSSQYLVERMISMKPIPSPVCDIRPG